MKQRPRSKKNNSVWLSPPWVKGSWARLLTSHVMTNSERLPPPPLTLAGVTFGAGERRRISLALLTSHNAENAQVIVFLVATPKWQREVTLFCWDLNLCIQKSFKISANFSKLSHVCRHFSTVMFFNQKTIEGRNRKTNKGYNLSEALSGYITDCIFILIVSVSIEFQFSTPNLHCIKNI